MGLKLISITFLIILLPIFILSSNHNMYATPDEPAMIYQGLRLTVHPKLAKEFHRGPLTDWIAGIQFYFKDIPIPLDHSENVNKYGSVTAPLILWEDFPNVLFWARLPFTMLSMILAFFVYKWGKELYGKNAGILALFFYVFSPNIIGYSSIVSVDFLLAFFNFFTLYTFWKYLKENKWIYAILFPLFLASAFLTKFTALFLIPSLVVLAILFKRKMLFRKKFLTIVLLWILSCWFIICSAYGFQGVFTPVGKSMERENLEAPFNISLNLLKLPPMLPYDYVKAFVYQLSSSSQSTTYLIPSDNPSQIISASAGSQPEWFYFILSFLVKTPLPLLIILGVVILFYSKVKKFDDLFLIIPVVVFYAIFSIFVHRQHGYRFMLMCIPLIIIFASKVTNLNIKFKRLFVLGLCLWFVFSSIAISPHYLSYFNHNQENAYEHWIGANIDWGQDLYKLYDYLDEQNVTSFKFAFYGFPPSLYNKLGHSIDLPQMRGIKYELFCGKTDGLIAISVTELQTKKGCYGWLFEEEPIKRVGYSIFVYNITW